MKTHMTHCVYISLGGNQGDVPGTFAKALQAIERIPGIHVDACSSLYQTEPQGLADQPWFLNQVLRLGYTSSFEKPYSDIDARHLLKALLTIEAALGRTRDGGPRFGPRPIDIDMLLFGNIVCATQQLTLPHPRMLKRAFILVPLQEIAPDLVLPGGNSVEKMLDNLRFSVDGTKIFQH